MKYARLYADKSGISHFEDVEVELSSVDFAPPAPPMDVASLALATNVGIVGAPAGRFGPLHPAPRRILFFYLTGVTEVTASDGEVRRFVPGNILLVEDTSGKGHTTRSAGNEYAAAMMVQLVDE